jgi:hypothetical protein
MKTPRYVIAPEGCAKYLTPGKRYAVACADDDPAFFALLDDEGDPIRSSFKNAHVLNGGDWIIPDDEAEAPKAEAPAGDERRFVAACHAMQGLVSIPTDYENRSCTGTAREAVDYADALLAALKGKDGK